MVLFAVLASAGSHTATANGNHKTNANMTLSFAGVGVGRLENEIIIKGDTYVIGGVAKTNKIVSIIAKTNARFHSIGTLKGNLAIPQTHNLTYKRGKKSGSVAFEFGKSGLKNSSVSPVVNYGASAVPVLSAHLSAVLDPVTTAVFPVKSDDVGKGSAICNRTLKIYDGKNRFDLKFRYVSQQKRRAKGFSGPTYTCSVQYVPVSGHTPTKKGVRYMQANQGMRVIMARVGSSNVYTMFGFRVPLKQGVASGMAYRFSH